MSIDISQFHQVFFEESFEGLDAMEMGLLDLEEGQPDLETINTIFRAAHSIKGGAGTFGFMAVSDFTHHLETLLDEMRNGKRLVTREAMTVCLQAVDLLREMLNAVRASQDLDDERIKEVADALQALLNKGNLPVATAAPDSTAEQATDKEPAAGWKITFTPHAEMLQTGNDPVRLFYELSDLGDISVTLNDSQLPPFPDLDPEACYLQWVIELKASVEQSAITEIFEWVEGDCELTIAPLSTHDDTEPTALASPKDSSEERAENEIAADLTENNVTNSSAPVGKNTTAGSATTATTERHMASIRVDTVKVDSLINLVGELVITQSMLSQMGEEFVPERLPSLLDGLEQLARHTRELQEGIMLIRMIPISFAFNRFPRLVRDLSAKLGKKVELKLSGAQTELDKTVMEKIGDPLTHLVRNSLDHGLETAERRIAAGKPATGLLHLNAYHQGGNIVIDIEDDGAGLNEPKILEKAKERGLVSEHEVLSPEKIHELIFMPGFSTADVVSDISGRGVGMDVVKKNIHALGGSIEVKSEPGKGSRFTIRLPLTLAIMDGQIIEVADQRYIVPLLSIVESVVIKGKTTNKVAGKGELYLFRDEYIPLIRLYEVFGLKPNSEQLEGGLLVVVESNNSKVGLLVDDLQSQQQIVIKSLETNYRNVMGLSGATILGDGSVALILDVAGLVTMYRGSSRADNPTEFRVA
ncbi:chemotaxis protein CheA [Nitrincola sp. MINF-07-Sa-05]|uniref:chemotaxis protein CheA n=1 Tax=Nitrincola salilacus TaxID=3400273 RepID=UPI003918206D